MSVQTRPNTLAEAVFPKPAIGSYVALIVAISLLFAFFEALFPENFSLVDSFSGTDFLLDTLKNLGLVVAFGLSLAFLGRVFSFVADLIHSRTRLEDAIVTLFDPASWPIILADGVRITAFSLILTLFARISIHFGDNPVPVTGQTLAVLLTGAALGSRLGALSVLMYLAQGSAGMHVYAGGGLGYFWDLASGGYLIGFVATAYIIGFLVERGWDRGLGLLLAMLAGNVVLYVSGLIQLALFVGWDKTLAFGLYPFIPGDLAKLYIASLIVPSAWALVALRRRALAFSRWSHLLFRTSRSN